MGFIERLRMILPEDRQMAIELIDEAVTAGAGQQKACEVLEITPRTLPSLAEAAH